MKRNEADTPKITPDESATLDWCYHYLSEEQIADCWAEARDCADFEINEQEAAERLTRLLARIMVRTSG